MLLASDFSVALPSLIEIVPPASLAAADVTIPGSKSITNRALILAALAEGTVCLEGALWSEDTEVMVDCLRRLGFRVNVEPDPAESANRRIQVVGRGGVGRGAYSNKAHPLRWLTRSHVC